MKESLNAALRYLPLGCIKPGGWLRNQLRLQAENVTGPLPDHWKDLGEDSGWQGGRGESWERGPYYLDGLIPLAWGLNDEKLILKAVKRVEWILNSQDEEGFFGPPDNRDWWPRMVVVKTLTLYQEATRDARVVPFLEKYFRYHYTCMTRIPLDQWGHVRGAEEILAIHWLYKKTGGEWLLDFADALFQQMSDWTDFFNTFPYKKPMADVLEETMGSRTPGSFAVEDISAAIPYYHHTHGVNMAMGLKTPVVRYEQTGESQLLKLVKVGWMKLLENHGTAGGLFSGDEHLSGTSPEQGVETCSVVEYLFSLEEMYRITGDVFWTEALERGVYNALPASMTSDVSCHQYFQQDNQLRCTVEEGPWYSGTPDSRIFGMEPNFGCCTANLHQGWPKFLRSLWLTTAEGGLRPLSYAPCQVATGDEFSFSFVVGGEYPFGNVVTITIQEAPAQDVVFELPIPSWAADPECRINYRKVIPVASGKLLRISRQWQKGDSLELFLPKVPRFKFWPGGTRSVELGPLTMTAGVPEIWQRLGGSDAFPDWEVFSRDKPDTPEWEGVVFGVPEFRSPGSEPFSSSIPPVILPYTSTGEEKKYLYPYGCTRIRRTRFPE